MVGINGMAEREVGGVDLFSDARCRGSRRVITYNICERKCISFRFTSSGVDVVPRK